PRVAAGLAEVWYRSGERGIELPELRGDGAARRRGVEVKGERPGIGAVRRHVGERFDEIGTGRDHLRREEIDRLGDVLVCAAQRQWAPSGGDGPLKADGTEGTDHPAPLELERRGRGHGRRGDASPAGRADEMAELGWWPDENRGCDAREDRP